MWNKRNAHQKRVKSARLQQPCIEEEEDVIGGCVCENKHIEETQRTIHKFGIWIIIEKKMKKKRANKRP